MKLFKKIIAGMLCASCLVTLAGCGGSFNASDYVKGIMDNVYLGDATLYKENVDISTEEAQKEYEDGIESEVDLLLYGFDCEDVSQSVYDKFVTFYKDVYKNAKYEVKEAKKDGDVYKVEVSITPITLIKDSMDELDVAFEEAVKPDYESKTDACDAIGNAILTVLNQNKSEIKYGEPQTVTVTLEQDEDKLWGMSDDDFLELDTLILLYE